VKLRAPVDLVISGSRLVTPEGVVRTDVAVDGGRIAKFGRSATMPNADDRVSLPSSSLLLPGVVDVHAHLRGLELSHKGDFATESQSAAGGGVTYAIGMPNSRPPTLTAPAFEEKRDRASKMMAVDFGLNLGVQGNDEELTKVGENMAYGEIFVGPSTEGSSVGYDALGEALRIISTTGKVACIHAEDPGLFLPCGEGDYDHARARPPDAEALAIAKVLSLNERIGARVHICHVSTREGLLLVGRHRSAGMSVTCEVTPHHLMLSGEVYDDLGPAAKMNPPLRGPGDVGAMLEGISSGMVDILASDHAPHAVEEKSVGEPDAPSGVPGFETFVPAVLTRLENHGIPPSTFVRRASLAPADIFGIPGKGFGRGKDADLVVLDTPRRKVDPESFVTMAKYSPFSGMSLKYWPMMTFVRGQAICEGGEIIIKNRGRFVPPEA
jgi:dihydroorotase